MHYSQAEPCFELEPVEGNARLDVRGSGFLTTELIHAGLRRWAARRKLAGQRTVPGQVCIDLRNVTGYGAGCAKLAHGWLKYAGALGVRQVAIVAHSAVLRTASVLVARGLSVQICCFASWDAADDWLCGVSSRRADPWTPAAAADRRRGEVTESRPEA